LAPHLQCTVSRSTHLLHRQIKRKHGAVKGLGHWKCNNFYLCQKLCYPPQLRRSALSRDFAIPVCLYMSVLFLLYQICRSCSCHTDCRGLQLRSGIWKLTWQESPRSRRSRSQWLCHDCFEGSRGPTFDPWRSAAPGALQPGDCKMARPSSRGFGSHTLPSRGMD